MSEDVHSSKIGCSEVWSIQILKPTANTDLNLNDESVPNVDWAETHNSFYRVAHIRNVSCFIGLKLHFSQVWHVIWISSNVVNKSIGSHEDIWRTIVLIHGI